MRKGINKTLSFRSGFLLGSLAILQAAGVNAAVVCTMEPAFSVIAQGQTINLKATCVENQGNADPTDDTAYNLKRVNWHLGSTTDALNNTPIDAPSTITLTNPGHIVHFTTPVSLGSTSSLYIELWGDTDLQDSLAKLTTAPAQVVVEAAGALSTDATNVAGMNAKTHGQCATGYATGESAQAMPTGAAACASGKQTLAITTPTAFTWTCASTSGGADASCYATQGYTVSTSAGAGGSLSPNSQGVQASGSATVIATPSSGMSVSSINGCGGAPWSGTSSAAVTYTTGAVNASCTVSATFIVTPENQVGACGPTTASLTVTPDNQKCTSSAAFTSFNQTAANWTWTCPGTGSGNPAACTQVRKYTVTATDNNSANGDVSPASVDVQYGQTTTFTASPASGFVASFSGCGTSGTSGRTSPITGVCEVTVAFNEAAANPTSDPGPWTGFWIPPAGSNVTVGDVSGTQGSSLYNYIPGCANQRVAENSGSGCAVNSQVSDNNISFSFGNGRVLSLRLRSKTTSTSGSFSITSGLGSTLGSQARAWISSTPGGTPLVAKCDSGLSSRPLIYTNYTGYCVLNPDTPYYLNIQSDGSSLLKFVDNGSFQW